MLRTIVTGAPFVLLAVLAGCSCEGTVDLPDAGPLPDASGLDAPGADVPGLDAPTIDAPPGCGNGIIEPPEDCDDGNLTSGDGCSDLCVLEVAPGCGNGVVEIGEACDDGNANDDDACLSTCALARCGDGIRRLDLAPGAAGYEECDDGNGSDRDGCLDGATGTCALARCGDGITRRDRTMGMSGYEVCDDGNTTPGDGCDGSCLLEGSCGDGVVDTGEACDLGSANADEVSGACPAVCRRNCQCPSCGDGVADFAAGEACDDGNTVSGDGCSSTCAIEAGPSCGDGDLDVIEGEECDDGNTISGDGCDASCQLEPVGLTCGDSTIDPLEVCDPPEVMPADGTGCNATCNLAGNVTTLAMSIPGASVLTSDDKFLYVGIGGCGAGATPDCGIATIDIAACNAAPTTAACDPTFIAGGPGRCACGSAPADGGPTTATFAPMGSMATDGATIWFGSPQALRELDLATGVVTTVAGVYGSCAAIDGVGTSALLHDVRGLTYWRGSVYLLDGCEEVLRRFDPASRSLTTIAGTRYPDPGVTQSPPYACGTTFRCVTGAVTPGYGTSASFGSPRYMTADNSGNLFFIDTNGQAIWRYNTVTTYAEVLASGAAPGATTAVYADGASATLGRPRGIVSDGTSVYFAEQGYSTIRQLEPSGVVTTLVGATGCTMGSRDGFGANSTRIWGCTGPASTPPAGTPIFGGFFGALTFEYGTNAIYAIDGGRLRRID